MKTILFILVIVLLTFNLYSTIINVPADQSTIQAGILAAANTDTVLVQPGTYVENINYNGKLITIGSLFLTTADTSHVSSTIIDGNAIGSAVKFESGEDLTAILIGFSIINGLDNFGGGIYCEDSSPTLTSLIISGNSANNGGGISCNNSSPFIWNVSILDNSTVNNGGGIYTFESNPSLKNVTIFGNSASYGGGISSNENSSISLNNVTISGNSASIDGGGIECWNNSNPSLLNCILWNDSPQEISLTSSSITSAYSDIEGGWVGTGNIDSNPLFVDAGSDDYHLQLASPCIDAGDNASPLDPDETRADMGAYYFNQYNGPIWSVSTTGSDISGTGTGTYPFSTIQHGIDSSSNADTVLVQPGTYFENLNYNGKNITVGSLCLTTQDTTYITSTIIDGNRIDSVVKFENGENSTAFLCGFTITNGLVFNSESAGGGIYCNGSSPTLTSLDVSGNTAVYVGGGIYCYESSPILTNLEVSGNTSAEGGGIYCENSSPTFTNLEVSGNTSAAGSGGGICCSDTDLILYNVEVSGNTSTEGGGGISCSDTDLILNNVVVSQNFATDGGGIVCQRSNLILNHVLISNNHADEYEIGGLGGGIYCDSGSSLDLDNVTLSGNTATSNAVYSAGGGIYIHSYADLSLANCITWDNAPEEIHFCEYGDPNSITLTLAYSDIEGDSTGIVTNDISTVTWLDGNVNSNPQFVNPSIGDYHLQPTSPCIDAGDPLSPLDPDGTIADMGTYYHYQDDIPPTAEFIADTIQGYSPLTVNFTDLSNHGSVLLNDWYWDFGDENNSPLQNPTHEYLPGIYTVSLTVTDVNDSIDTETKTDYITVYSSDPPAPPTDVQVDIIHPDALIAWTAVDTTLSGDPCITNGYIISYSEIPDDEYFWFLAFTANTSYTHQDVAQYSPQMFYKVISFVDLSREEIKYLKGLNDSHRKIRVSEVKERLELKNSIE